MIGEKENKVVWAALLAVTALAAVAGCAALRRAGSPFNAVAAAHGAGGFDRVEALRYTFNVKIGDTVASRRWEWEPRTDRVTFHGSPAQGGVVAYERAALAGGAPEALKKVDAWFINDNYWLLFPLRVHWDAGAAVAADDRPAEMPLGGGRGRRLVVRFPPDGGYTPGDVYELFTDEAGRIRQWIYRKGGAAQPTRVTTWEAYSRYGPLLIALERRGADESFRVWFTEVAVKLAGESSWRGGTPP